MPESLLSRVCVVLVEAQDPVNIAATVRVMKNMGVADLRLVRPVAYDPFRIEGIAHDTRDIVERIRHFETLDEAIADCVRVASFAGKRRAAKWIVVDPRAAATDLLSHATDGPVAVVFGREDWGLPRAALDRAQLTVHIPTTEHSSLNVAQAVLVALYELHIAAGDATRVIGPPRKDAPPATSAAYEQLFVDAQKGLETIDFFKTRSAEYVMRTVRSLAFRANPDGREIQLVRAFGIEIQRAMERAAKGNRESAGRESGAGSRQGAGSGDVD